MSTSWLALWLTLLASIAAFCWYTWIRGRLISKRMRWLRPPSDANATPLASDLATITAIVPARNEEADLEESLRSLLAQEGVDLRVIVVNDHSSDRTGEIADRIAAADDRVTVLHDPPLRDGWFGKVNAMNYALERVETKYVLLSDADTRHHPQALRLAFEQMRTRDLSLLTLMPSFEMRSLMEHALLPGLLGWIALNLGPWVEDPESPKALGVGAFLLLRTADLRRTRSFEAVKTEMLDDVKLAESFKRNSLRVGWYWAPDLLCVRMFKGNREAFTGMTKNVLAATGQNSVQSVLAAVATTVGTWLPVSLLIASVVIGHYGLLAASATTLACQFVGPLLFRHVIRFKPHKLVGGFFFPVTLFFCLARALYHRHVKKAVWWRGRSIAFR